MKYTLSFILIFIISIYPRFLYAEFTLRDIEQYCEAYINSENNAEIECSRSKLNVIESKCEVYIYNFPYGNIECTDESLNKVEKKCEIYMYSKRFGEIDC